MQPSSESLADFDNPPVVETVLSVQFEPLLSVQTAHLGLLWREYASDFPLTSEHPALDQVVELFPERPRARLGLRLEAVESMPLPRLWFVTLNGNEMIQVQNDRFIKNWRQEGEGPDCKYPRYPHVRASFDRDYKKFLDFLSKNDLGCPHVNQCEVTYVNHILAGEGWDRFGELHRVFTFWSRIQATPPGDVEDLRLHARFIIPGDSGKPIGRLHADLQPAVRNSDDHPMYVLHLTARGQVGDGVEFFDVGRRWIVKTFISITQPEMHRNVWGVKSHGS